MCVSECQNPDNLEFYVNFFLTKNKFSHRMRSIVSDATRDTIEYLADERALCDDTFRAYAESGGDMMKSPHKVKPLAASRGKSSKSASLYAAAAADIAAADDEEEEEVPSPPKRGRGRPRKIKVELAQEEVKPPPKKRGRPPKDKTSVSTTQPPVKRGRGRPRKHPAP